MLFSGKENVFMCLSATKFVLWKINSGVWFIQTFLQKMLYMPNFPYTSLTVNMQIMNQFHTHSQKKQYPAKKFIKSSQIEIARRRRRWDRAMKARSVRSTSALVGRSHRSLIAPLVDWRARSQSRSTSGSIVRRARLSIDERRNRPTSGAIASEVSSSSLSLRSGLSLLSLSLSLWKWFEVKMRV